MKKGSCLRKVLSGIGFVLLMVSVMILQIPGIVGAQEVAATTEVQIMKEFRLEKISYIEAQEYAENGAIVILPLSPLEAHGPHLPLGVDFFGAAKLSEMCARILNEKHTPAVVAPLLPYAVADFAMPFAGTVSLRQNTIKAIVADIAKSFRKHGFKGLVIVCQHLEGTNLNALIEISAELSESVIPTLTVNPFKSNMGLMNKLMKCEFPELDVHAGEWETAFCLWACPELVKKDILKDLPPTWVNPREKSDGEGPKNFIEAGATQCYLGDPACATADLGEKSYNILAKSIVEEIVASGVIASD